MSQNGLDYPVHSLVSHNAVWSTNDSRYENYIIHDIYVLTDILKQSYFILHEIMTMIWMENPVDNPYNYWYIYPLIYKIVNPLFCCLYLLIQYPVHTLIHYSVNTLIQYFENMLISYSINPLIYYVMTLLHL